MDTTIRLATIEDLNKINSLFKKVINDLEKKKINMWNSIYPFCEFEINIINKEMYVLENKNNIIESFTLSKYDDPDNHLIAWSSNNKNSFT